MAKAAERTVEVQRTRLMELKDFELSKVKIAGKYVDVSHHESGMDAGDVEKKGQTVPHPDLKLALDTLAPIMARRLGLLQGTDLAKDMFRGDLENYEKVHDLEKLIVSRINVGGITINGTGEKRGVIITGSFEVPEGGSVGCATPKITFGSDVLGYEDEVEELCQKVIEETHAYRFCNKKAQLDIFTESEKVDKEESSKMKVVSNFG